MNAQQRLIVIFMVMAADLIYMASNVFSQTSELNVALSKSYLSPLTTSPPPTFTSGTRIQANGVDIKVDTYAAAACVADWNADGKKDLLIGCFYYGNVYLYLNSGTNSNPVFTTGSKLQANGTDISVAYG
ncbi:MAG: hypothetical protein ONB11_01810 [candidate division KSB1 bacterium]|nr:hypothetical protein [candidate division KSB1 bacterium]MDZ7341413.1 hypothetical protein [candidate division KSB1 bacterium]